MRVLVTGGAGYIGSATVAALVREGHEVVIYDSLEKGWREAVPKGALLEIGDLADEAAIREALEKNRCELVMHFAAYSLVGESMRAPEKYFRNNIANGLNLLEAMRAAGVGKIIFSSTAATYGNPEEIPMTESHPTVPINPYGESKRCFEKILHRYHDTYGFNYVSLRYFNAAGCTEGQGEDHRPETHIIPLVLKVALGREKAARIYGTDYDTDDGTCVRDYIHIEDLAAAHIRAMTCTGGHIYNLGNGEGFSVREVIETARRVTGKEVKADEAPRRPGDPPVLVASSEKIRRELGWEPRHPSLEEMIESAWKWMRAHPDGYRE